MRLHLLAQLKKIKKSVVEKPWTREQLTKFEAIAYSNSVVGVIPITSVQNADVSYLCDPNHGAIRSLQKLSGYHHRP